MLTSGSKGTGWRLPLSRGVVQALMRTSTKIIAVLVAVLVIGGPFKLYAGKSIRFFLDSKFRAPFNAKIIESGNRAVGRDGECIFIFETDDDTIKAYLSRAPWKNAQWKQAPVPREALSWTDEIAAYVKYFSDSDVWYMHQQPIRPEHDEGRLIVIDAPKRRVYFSFWWW